MNGICWHTLGIWNTISYPRYMPCPTYASLKNFHENVMTLAYTWHMRLWVLFPKSGMCLAYAWHMLKKWKTTCSWIIAIASGMQLHIDFGWQECLTISSDSARHVAAQLGTRWAWSGLAADAVVAASAQQTFLVAPRPAWASPSSLLAMKSPKAQASLRRRPRRCSISSSSNVARLHGASRTAYLDVPWSWLRRRTQSNTRVLWCASPTIKI